MSLVTSTLTLDQKHFAKKRLAILRSCSELLRRLSRAEDMVFGGRVFIFLFQSCPLGDKSSVNLRGAFHVDNITTFDEDHRKSANAIQPMGADDDSGDQKAGDSSDVPASTATKEDAEPSAQAPTPSTDDESVDLNTLYPIFWGMQTDFSNPTRLFQPEKLLAFKKALSATLKCFQKVHISNLTPTKRIDEKRGVKRKKSSAETGAELSNTSHTKYLTNRDLFDLEVHDIAFRRHILVQALIILDFLLSLTPSAKQKAAAAPNKAIFFPFTLSDENATWALTTKASIASYLQQGDGNEGKFYYRMVDTVLSRDKNWVRWKAYSCPGIEKPPVSGEEHLRSQQTLQKLCTKRPHPPPPGAAELNFLSQTTTLDSLKDKLYNPSMPTAASFYKGIKNDELDAEMGSAEEMRAATEAKDGKLWRALRASKNRFNLCERIENGKNLESLLEDENEPVNVALAAAPAAASEEILAA